VEKKRKGVGSLCQAEKDNSRNRIPRGVRSGDKEREVRIPLSPPPSPALSVAAHKLLSTTVLALNPNSHTYITLNCSQH